MTIQGRSSEYNVAYPCESVSDEFRAAGFSGNWTMGNSKELEDAYRVLLESSQCHPDRRNTEAYHAALELMSTYWDRFWLSSGGQEFRRFLELERRHTDQCYQGTERDDRH